MSITHKRLGRGIEALIGSAASLPDSRSIPGASGGGGAGLVREVPLSELRAGPYQPRQSFPEESIRELAESIRSHGVVQPIVVRPAASSDRPFEVVAGERRWRAALLAGLSSIPAIVREMGDQQAAECALIENVQREDLNPMDRARAFRALSDRFGLTHEQIAQRVGLERATVTNFMRLTELEASIAELLVDGRLSIGHAKVLLSLPPGEGGVRTALAMSAASENWTIRRLESAAKQAQRVAETEPKDPQLRAREAVMRDLETRLGEYLGSKVEIRTDRTGKRGRITIEFYGLDHFDGVMSKIGYQPGGS